MYKCYLSRHAIANVRNPKISRARGDGYGKPTGPREEARRRKNPLWRGGRTTSGVPRGAKRNEVND